jgi:hypothetical protein
VRTHIVRTAGFIAVAAFIFAVGTATAAPSYTSKVTVSQESPYWHGKVLSSKFRGIRSCERDRLVKVFKRREGKNLQIGTDLSNRSGRWVIPDNPTQGRYYAKVTARRAGDKPGCDKDQSAAVFVD